MPNNAIKITYGANTVYFDTEEINDTAFTSAGEHQVHVKQDGAPNIKYMGNDVQGLQIVFNLMRYGTQTKLDQILDAAEELTVYYAYQYDTALHLHCVPVIDGMEEVETFGYIDELTKTVQFLKSAA